MELSSLPAWDDYYWDANTDPPCSPEEFLELLDREAAREEEEYLNQMSRYEREKYLQQKAEGSCRTACQRLKNLRSERRKLLWSALYKPILMPASLIGGVIAGAVAQGDIGLLAAGIGITTDIAVAGWWLRKTICRLPILRRQMQKHEETIRGYQDRYGWEARMLLMEENIDL